MYKVILAFAVITYAQLNRVEQARHLFLGEGDSYRALKILERLDLMQMTKQETQAAISLGSFIAKQIGDTLRWNYFQSLSEQRTNTDNFLKNQLQILLKFQDLKRVGDEIFGVI